jgi:hypothetical protein
VLAPFVVPINSWVVESGYTPAVPAAFVKAVPSVAHQAPAVPGVQAGGEVPVCTLTTFKPEVFVQVKVFAVVAPSSQRVFVGGLPAPPPFMRKPVFKMAEEEDCVVELK